MTVGKLSVTWWGLSAFTFFIGASILMIFKFRDTDVAMRAIRWLAFYVFSYKGIFYFVKLAIHKDFPDSIPIEYSQIAYLMIGIAFLFKITALYDFTAFISLIAGFANLVSILLYGESYLINSTYDIFIIIFMHGFLYLAGIIYFTKVKKLKLSSAWQFYVGSLLIIGYTQLLYLTVCNHMVVVLIELVYGRILPFTMFPFIKHWPFHHFFDIVVLFSFLVGVIYLINYCAFRKKTQNTSN